MVEGYHSVLVHEWKKSDRHIGLALLCTVASSLSQFCLSTRGPCGSSLWALVCPFWRILILKNCFKTLWIFTLQVLSLFCKNNINNCVVLMKASRSKLHRLQFIFGLQRIHTYPFGMGSFPLHMLHLWKQHLPELDGMKFILSFYTYILWNMVNSH